jgi:hypothetical protein
MVTAATDDVAWIALMWPQSADSVMPEAAMESDMDEILSSPILWIAGACAVFLCGRLCLALWLPEDHVLNDILDGPDVGGSDCTVTGVATAAATRPLPPRGPETPRCISPVRVFPCAKQEGR